MRPMIPPPVFGLIAAGLLWAADRYLPGLSVSFPGQAMVAVIVAAIGVMIETVGIAAFVRQKTTVNPLRPERANSLVISGLYRYSRNPMYLGMAFLLCGWALYLGTLSVLVIVPAFIWVLTEVQIKPEEVALEALFGEDYRAYMQRVRRWL